MARRTAGSRRWQPTGPDPVEILGRLRLTTGRAARVCGVTRRQLCYWTDQGIIDSVPPSGSPLGNGDLEQRTYDCAALRKVLLLKQSLAQGLGVRRAAKEAEATLDAAQRRSQAVRGFSPEERQPMLADHAERLDEAAQRLQQLVAAGDRARLVAAAGKLEAMSEVCAHILGNGTSLHEDGESCLDVERQLERLEVALAEPDAGES